MANDAERRGYYKQGYYKLLDELEKIKGKKPSAYDDVAEVVRNYKEWVKGVGEIDDLPDVPPK